MKLEKKYGLFTAISMVVGIVIGSGVFFKAQDVLKLTNGNMPLGILAWVLGGLVMMACIYSFSVMATKYEKINGLIDYAEVSVGKKYGYYVGWFITFIYYPAMTSVLAWVSARYFCEIFNLSLVSAECMTLAGFFLILSYAVNALSPIIAGKLQVSTTIIKLIPLILTAVVGLIYGLVSKVPTYEVIDGELVKNGMTEFSSLIQNFKTAGNSGMGVLFSAVVATAFAYEGWIIATSINAEIKDAKKNLPKALIIGSIIIISIYVLYYIGVAGGADASTLINGGAMYAFKQIFGDFMGTVLRVLIVISCLGTLNGLMLGTARGMYSIAIRGEGPRSDVFSVVDPKTNMPTNSSIVGLLMCAVWLVFFYGANLASSNWFGLFAFDSSELPIITIYAFYIPIFLHMIIKEKDLGVFKRFVMPIVSIIACIFMVVAAFYAHGITKYEAAKEAGNFSFPILFYLIIFALIMLIAFLIDKFGKKVEKEELSDVIED